MIEKGDQLISPFIYEYQLKQIEGIHIGTVLETRKQINIVIEMETGFTIESIRNEIRRCNLVMDELMVVKKIPRDPRHHSKIDYEKLKEQLMILDMAR